MTVTIGRRELLAALGGAAAALRDFAAETLKSNRDEKLWVFDPGVTAGDSPLATARSASIPATCISVSGSLKTESGS